MTSSTVSSDSVSGQARGDLCGMDSYPVTVSSKHVETQARGHPCSSEISEEQLLTKPTKNPKTKKKWITIKNEETCYIPTYRNGCKNSEKISWMTEFLNTETHTPVLLVSWMTEFLNTETHTPVLLVNHLLEPTPAKCADLGKHSVYTHFPKDRNCEICQRTKITRAPCRRRIGGAVPRAENFGDLITADDKVLSEGCESRNNHRYAVVVQDLATQWIQSYPCKTKTSQETLRSLQKFLEPNGKPTVIYTDNSLEFGNACEDLSWNHCTSSPHRSVTNGIAERAVRRVKEGTSAVLLQSGLDENWWADSMECYTYLRNIQDRLSGGKTPIRETFWETI